MVALMTHARNLDEVLEQDDSKADVTSTLMENFSWLELGIFFVNVLLYLSSIDKMQTGITNAYSVSGQELSRFEDNMIFM